MNEDEDYNLTVVSGKFWLELIKIQSMVRIPTNGTKIVRNALKVRLDKMYFIEMSGPVGVWIKFDMISRPKIVAIKSIIFEISTSCWSGFGGMHYTSVCNPGSSRFLQIRNPMLQPSNSHQGRVVHELLLTQFFDPSVEVWIIPNQIL